MKIKFIKNHKDHKKGDTAEVTPNDAIRLIDSGVAIAHKMVDESTTKERDGDIT